MKVHITESYDQSCELVANRIIELVRSKPDALLGLATGSTPVPVYQRLAAAHKEGLSFARVSAVNLDEYAGLKDASKSYRAFMEEHLFGRVDIDPANVTIADFRGDPETEAARLRDFFAARTADFQILGVGHNGHIGFNEPDAALFSAAHVTTLAPRTVEANARFFGDAASVPRRAVTMGMGEIMAAREIALIATGHEKAPAVRSLRDGLVTPQWPCTFLKLCPHATVYADESAL